MDKITPGDVENFMDSRAAKGSRNTSINAYYTTLRTMLAEAVNRNVIPANPAEKVKKLVNDRKEIRIITREEFKNLFVENREKVWGDDNKQLSCIHFLNGTSYFQNCQPENSPKIQVFRAILFLGCFAVRIWRCFSVDTCV